MQAPRAFAQSHSRKSGLLPQLWGMFSNNTKFYDHLRRQTSLDQHRFQCTHCSKRFATERLLRDHMRNHVNHYKCPLCDMTCPLPSTLRTHIRFRHSDERPFKCEHCDYSCKNLVDLRKHLDTHSKLPAYCCEYEDCSFTARSLCSVKAHYRKVHEVRVMMMVLLYLHVHFFFFFYQYAGFHPNYKCIQHFTFGLLYNSGLEFKLGCSAKAC
ncbi:unnamed protein product, partial [Staurois parvus]